MALKILNPDVSGVEEIVCRLRDEARMLGLVRHPGIVHADALVQLDGRWTLVMEYVPGVSLSELLKCRQVPVRCAVELAGRIADALHTAHTATDEGRPLNLVHRDLKPGNVILGPSGEVKLLDFGVARAEFAAREAETRSMLFGSPDYMAPERWEFMDLPAGDVYSLGLVLYELLARRLFGRSMPAPEHHAARVQAALAEIENAFGRADTSACLGYPPLALPPAVRELLASMLAFDPAGRPSAREVECACRGLERAIPGPALRDWAEREVPVVTAARPARSGDPLSGATLVEPSGSLEVVQGSLPPDMSPGGRSRVWLLWGTVGIIAAALVITLMVVGLAGSWWLWRGEDVEALVAPVLSDTPTAPVPVQADPIPDPVATLGRTGGESAPTAPASTSPPVRAEEVDTSQVVLSEAPPEPDVVEVPPPPVPEPSVLPQVLPATPGEGLEPGPSRTVGTSMIRASGKGLTAVYLFADGTHHPAGLVHAGSYTIEASFNGATAVVAGRIELIAGESVTLHCSAARKRCTEKEEE